MLMKYANDHFHETHTENILRVLFFIRIRRFPGRAHAHDHITYFHEKETTHSKRKHPTQNDIKMAFFKGNKLSHGKIYA